MAERIELTVGGAKAEVGALLQVQPNRPCYFSTE